MRVSGVPFATEADGHLEAGRAEHSLQLLCRILPTSNKKMSEMPTSATFIQDERCSASPDF